MTAIEIWLRVKNVPETTLSLKMKAKELEPVIINTEDADSSASENKQGIRMIAIGILATALIMGTLGIIADHGQIYVLGMSFLLLLIGYRIFPKTQK